MVTVHEAHYQLGDAVPLFVTSVSTAPAATQPDSTPTAQLFTAAGSSVETVKLPLIDSAKWLFGLNHLLDSSYSAGTYLVVYKWTISSTIYQAYEHFLIRANGDADGNIHSMAGVDMDAGPHLVYSTESGKFVSGRRPRL